MSKRLFAKIQDRSNTNKSALLRCYVYSYHVLPVGVFGQRGRGWYPVRRHVHILAGVCLHRSLPLTQVSIHVWRFLLHQVFCCLHWDNVGRKPLDVDLAVFIVCLTVGHVSINKVFFVFV